MYVDSAYIAKFYLNEPNSPQVRKLLARADVLVSSTWAVAEVTCAFHRHLREGRLDQSQLAELLTAFLFDASEGGVWELTPITERILRVTAAKIIHLPAATFIRAGDAVHLATAADLGEREIWTSDRHVLAAAPHFGLTGRSA